MLLSNSAIFDALDDGRLVIEPVPKPRERGQDTKSPFDSTAVNLTLGNRLSIPKIGMSIAFHVPRGNISDTLATTCNVKILNDDETYNLEPNKLILASTREVIKLPKERRPEWGNKPLLAARVEGKSSFARIGVLVHFTAPTIHCGFEGRITLEIICLGGYPVVLKPGMEICQLLIEEVTGDPKGYVSQFQSQSDPTGSVRS
jgi:dCTP deaminase